LDWRLELVQVPGSDVHRAKVFDWGSFVSFSDPGGNRWAVQQLPPRG